MGDRGSAAISGSMAFTDSPDRHHDPPRRPSCISAWCRHGPTSPSRVGVLVPVFSMSFTQRLLTGSRLAGVVPISVWSRCRLKSWSHAGSESRRSWFDGNGWSCAHSLSSVWLNRSAFPFVWGRYGRALRCRAPALASACRNTYGRRQFKALSVMTRSTAMSWFVYQPVARVMNPAHVAPVSSMSGST
jgi:hypothetical protein